MKILVLGASGMTGNALFRELSKDRNRDVIGTVRSPSYLQFFTEKQAKNLITNIDLARLENIHDIYSQLRPDVVINCIGIIKQIIPFVDTEQLFSINSLLPRQLCALAHDYKSRLIHVSTDCIFNGKKGNYSETDICDADDAYGKSKYLGELDQSHCVTLRTSIIGHELNSRNGLLEWFLSQHESCNAYRNAVFSGLPVVVFANVIADIIIPTVSLTGIYNIAANPISKFDLLSTIADIYNKDIKIIPVEEPVIDRSLNPDKFKQATGYVAPEWPDMIEAMHNDYMGIRYVRK